MGGTRLKTGLLELFNACWDTECLPQDFKDAVIVTVYKKKGQRSECGNHRGISLLVTAGKIMAKIILNRIKAISEEVLPESQCGFRAGRSTTDMIFTLRQLQEKAIEQRLSTQSLLTSLRPPTLWIGKLSGKFWKCTAALRKW